jgi:hypothetical protein
MKGDFSRFTFDPHKHYAGVLHQQGRVWLDSDWNEEVMERLAILQQELCDVVGMSGVPSVPGTAFQISPSSDPQSPGNFRIAGGHCYINGMLCQFEGDTTYFGQPDLWDPLPIPFPGDGSTLTTLIYLEVWQRLITYLEDDSIREIALGGPDTSVRLKTIAQVKFALLPGGNSNIDCTQSKAFLPVRGNGNLTTLQPAAAQQQALCKLPDPANFTGRQNHLYRVQIHDAGDVAGDNSGFVFTIPLSADAGPATLKLSTPLTAFQSDAALRSGSVTISDNTGASERVPISGIPDLSTLNLARPLRGSFTKQNAATVTGGVARFKWSRDNASFAVAVQNVQSDGVTLTLGSLGRDAASSLRQGDLVEITDDASELGSGRGHLTYLASDPDPDQFTVTIADSLPQNFVLDGNTTPPSGKSTRHLVLRRWDGVGDASAVFSDTGATPGMNLGDGVHIQFGGSDLRAGDYWQFATRTADGSVEALTNAPPAGVKRYWAPLAVVSWGPLPKTSPPSSPPPGGVVMTRLLDCRNIFPALINFPQAEKGFHVTAVNMVALSGTNPPLAPPLANVNSPLLNDTSKLAGSGTLLANVNPPLLNDTNVLATVFAGINIVCDAPVDPASIKRPTCLVSVEIPIGPGFLTVTLAGTIGLDNNGTTITWRPSSLQAFQSFLTNALQSLPADAGLLTRLILKSNSIWSQNDPTLFLDGDAFGFRSGNSPAISLSLPSGDKRRGGDFEMWFWLVAAPSFIVDLQASSKTITVGDTATLTAVLSAPAPAGNPGLAVSLDNANLAIVGTTPILANPGVTSVTFTVTAAKQGTTNLTASFGGQSVSLAMNVVPLPDVTGALQINPRSIVRGDSATATVNLTGPAPSKGTVVTLASSDATIAVVPGSVNVPQGIASAQFTIQSASSPGTATITAKVTATVSGSISVAPSQKDTKDAKDIPDNARNKQAKDTKDSKDQKESKESSDKTNQDNKNARDNKLTKDNKDNADTKRTKEVERKALEKATDLVLPIQLANGANGRLGVNAKNGSLIQPTAHTFITPEERPLVGQVALDASARLEQDSGRSSQAVLPVPPPVASAAIPDHAATAADESIKRPAKKAPAKKGRSRKK